MPERDRRFMVDEQTLKKVVEAANLMDGDVVLEIGAGTGNLTREISKHAKVNAVEKDVRLYETLKKQLVQNPNVNLILGDALKIEYPIYNKVVSNIPYSISRKLLERLIVEGFGKAVLIVQEEFAQKLCTPPGSEDYTMVSALTQSTCECEICAIIPAKAFRPQPRVDSAILKLTQYWKPPRDYVPFMKKIFSLKNKKLRNVLENPPNGFEHARAVDLGSGELRDLYCSF